MNATDINNQIDFITAAADALRTGDHETLDILRDINENWMQQDDQMEANIEMIKAIREAIEKEEDRDSDIALYQRKLRQIKKITDTEQ